MFGGGRDMQHSWLSARTILMVLCCGGLGACIEIPPELQNMDNPDSTRYEAECDCVAFSTGLMTKHLVKTCDVPALYVNELATAQRLQALCDEGDSQFTSCELNPFFVGYDGRTGCGSEQSCVPYGGCCYAYGPTCSQITCADSVLLEDGDLNCLDSSSRVAPSAGPSMWSHATVSSGTLQINTPEGNSTTQINGSLAFIGGNCTTGICPFEIVDVSLGASSFSLQGHAVTDPYVINDTAGAGLLFADASVFMLPSQSLEIYATATIEGQRHGLVAASDTPGVGLINQGSRQLVFAQSFTAYGDTIDVQLAASIDNLAPTVTLSATSTFECNAPGGANVVIDSNANDADGHITATQWFLDGSLLANTATTLDAFIPLGTHTLAVAVFDNDGAFATADTTVAVQDTTPPTLSFDQLCLWPPNHDLFAIDATAIHVTDVCDPNATVTFVSGTSNQADNGTGDGNTDNDIVVKPDSLCVRAERDGNVLAGRTYSITASATDGAGNPGELTFEIVVPHDQSPVCTSVGQPTNADDPRCVPAPPTITPITDSITDSVELSAATSPTPSQGGCNANGQSSGLAFGLLLVCLQRRRRRQ